MIWEIAIGLFLATLAGILLSIGVAATVDMWKNRKP